MFAHMCLDKFDAMTVRLIEMLIETYFLSFYRWHLLYDFQIIGTWVRRIHRSYIFLGERCRLFHVCSRFLRELGGLSPSFQGLHNRLRDHGHQNHRSVSVRDRSISRMIGRAVTGKHQRGRDNEGEMEVWLT